MNRITLAGTNQQTTNFVAGYLTDETTVARNTFASDLRSDRKLIEQRHCENPQIHHRSNTTMQITSSQNVEKRCRTKESAAKSLTTNSKSSQQKSCSQKIPSADHATWDAFRFHTTKFVCAIKALGYQTLRCSDKNSFKKAIKSHANPLGNQIPSGCIDLPKHLKRSI